ncbi:hypothetical protein MHBO_001511 [Bonamia ostreae]|uniref:Uncharacterized protein n=1 Tax=Bonamia ostreae TaxID=126728 RepID=A0ABV2AJ64_9EUKA
MDFVRNCGKRWLQNGTKRAWKGRQGMELTKRGCSDSVSEQMGFFDLGLKNANISVFFALQKLKFCLSNLT